MDVSESPGEDTPVVAKKPRKAPAKRAAKKVAAPKAAATAEESPAPAAKPARRTRTKKAAGTSADLELPLGDATPTPAPAPAEPRVDSTPAPVADERPVFKPARATAAPEPAPEPATAEASEKSSPDQAGGGQPAPDSSRANPAAGSDEQNASQDDGASREERKPWWERKKEKKKQKWLEKKQARGGGGGHQGGQAAPHPVQPPPPRQVVHHGDLPDPARFEDFAALDALAAELTQSGGEPLRMEQLYACTHAELTARVRELGIQLPGGSPNRLQMLEAILRHADETKRPVSDRGWIDLADQGHGFIVHEHVNYRLYPEDAYLPASLIRRFGLKRGHLVEVLVQPPRPGDRCPAVIKINSVMGGSPEVIDNVTPFEELEPYYPLKRILLEAPEIHKDISMRAIDLLTPVGFGQRGLIVAPPRTGKTVLLQNIANSISHNFPEKKLILLLIDERPEEVTDFKRHTKGEVVSSTFDESPESHVHAAEMVIEKARRLVEQGEHVVILLDSITRLARAYNALASNSGKIMSGGVEATALQRPKRFFGSARNIEGGGSITILATALIDTGSRMDEVIFEEFKGTGNMELHLDRGLSDKRIFPAINIDRSGTRKEELIYHPDEMLRVYGLRRAMQGIPPVEAMDMFIQRLKKTKTNAEFLLSLNR
ncbi:MAG: transcription termination factor Rho [Verrucomicrobiota bacterium]